MSTVVSFMDADVVRDRLSDLVDERVIIKYINIRDNSTERTARGTVVEIPGALPHSAPRFRIVHTPNSVIVLPNPDLQVLSISLQK